ncbi:hypothetical protein [Caulobacter sp. FWC2]|uniref:hypothetical protein n=1 Tax=Caulobacter sp. FWC2 TaxID=69664 RepID=UPI000C148077|nr:hypothetical protein [Caulobacter sp. FWC2]PIB93604.1 hypothetical protein CSW62_19725 [Caulobacter sp. FWC2]
MSSSQVIEKADAVTLDSLQQSALARHQEKIQSIKAFAAANPEHPYTLANRSVLELADTDSSWDAAGILSMSGALWWALNLTLDLAPPHVVIFNATGGPDWDIALFTSSVFGYFLVDPSTLHGTYDFRMQAVAGVDGEVSIDLYQTNGTQIGSFAGVVLGVSLSKLSGSGTITYK